jgi:predicted phosphoribosyltransferase
MLAKVVKSNLKKYTINKAENNEKEKQDDIFELGIPRGGVIIADAIARKLSADYDIVIVMKIRHPENKEQAIAAVMEASTTSYINLKLVNELQIFNEYIQKEKSEQIEEIER